MGRAEVVDLLMSEGVTEPLAWNIAIRMSTRVLDEADLAGLRENVDAIVCEHLQATGELDPASP